MKNKCLVIPCYNEQYRLPLNDYEKFYETYPDFHFLFVDDGSTDSTKEIINKFIIGKEHRIGFLNLERNEGKGEAVRRGMLNALEWKEFSIIGYLDADLSIPLEEAYRLITFIEKNDVLFVFASRIQIVGSNIKKKLVRHIIGRIFATIVSKMLKLTVYDTQCGAKFFKRDIVNLLFREKFISKWIFDIELFYRFLEHFQDVNIHSIAKEVPLDKCLHVEGSKIKLLHFIKIPFTLMHIFFYYRKKFHR